MPVSDQSVKEVVGKLREASDLKGYVEALTGISKPSVRWILEDGIHHAAVAGREAPHLEDAHRGDVERRPRRLGDEEAVVLGGEAVECGFGHGVAPWWRSRCRPRASCCILILQRACQTRVFTARGRARPRSVARSGAASTSAGPRHCS